MELITDEDGFSTQWKRFHSADRWRIERKVWQDREGNEHVDDSLVPPRYHVRLDRRMSYRDAAPDPILKVDGPFKIGLHNGYVIHVVNDKGDTVAMVPLPKKSYEADYIEENKSRPTMEQALWLAETIVAKLNETLGLTDNHSSTNIKT